jgi:hypothetical protein
MAKQYAKVTVRSRSIKTPTVKLAFNKPKKTNNGKRKA